MSHTNEPWRYWPPINADVIGRITHGEKARSVMVLDDANARRIVAAVNACAGIPTEALEEALDVDEGERMSHLAIVEAGLESSQ